MEDKEILKILDDPKKMLDLFKVFHRLLHLSEAKEMMAKKEKDKEKSDEKMGLSDSCDAKVIKANSN